MSNNEIVVVYEDSADGLFFALSQIPDDSIVAILDSNTRLANDNVEDMILATFKKDKYIGFVSTDILMVKGNTRWIEYLSDDALQNAPFFLKKISDLVPLNEQSPLVHLMNQMMTRGYRFEHISDPLLIMKQ